MANQKRKHVVVLSGAGVSAESGLKTFRDSDGLWEGHRIEDVATPRAWQKNKALVLEFYNQRRRDLLNASPNAAHQALAELEKSFVVSIITQNVDDLHERAGSSSVLHLHGELRKSRSTADENLVYDIQGTELIVGDLCEKGSQLRPHIVWFEEAVPLMDAAIEIANKADIFIIVGTSLVVYPAAGLVGFVGSEVPIYVVDPNKPELSRRQRVHYISEPASRGVCKVLELLKEYQ